MADYVERKSVYEVLASLINDIVDDAESPIECVKENTLRCVADKVKDIPAADVRSERHGHWITRHDGLPFCSECDYNGLGYIALDLDYCPHCGAKMDGKGEE